MDPFGFHRFNPLVLDWRLGSSKMSPSGLANVCGYLPAKDLARPWVILGAHMDATEPGAKEAALDNGSGVAVLLELARLASRYEWDRVLAFCFWGGEEDGLLGSTFYAAGLANAPLVQLYVNLDMVGLVWPGADTAWEHHFVLTGPAAVSLKLADHARHVRRDVLGFPDARFTERPLDAFPDCVLSAYVGFAAHGVPYAVFITGLGDPVCSNVYPIHGEYDTYAHFVANMGGEGPAAQGLAAQADLVFHTVALAAGEDFHAPA